MASKGVPVVAAGSPASVALEEGKTYYWCTCGRSKNQPFCDGSHKGTEFKPKKFVAPKTETAALCMCKFTKNAPFCDGSHAGPDALKAYNRQLLQANSQLRDEVHTLKLQVTLIGSVTLAVALGALYATRRA